MSQLILRHLDALAASMQLALAQIDAMKHAVSEPVKGAQVSLPERCTGVDANRCAEQDGEWSDAIASLADPSARKCKGCGYVRSGLTG